MCVPLYRLYHLNLWQILQTSIDGAHHAYSCNSLISLVSAHHRGGSNSCKLLHPVCLLWKGTTSSRRVYAQTYRCGTIGPVRDSALHRRLPGVVGIQNLINSRVDLLMHIVVNARNETNITFPIPSNTDEELMKIYYWVIYCKWKNSLKKRPGIRMENKCMIEDSYNKYDKGCERSCRKGGNKLWRNK